MPRFLEYRYCDFDLNDTSKKRIRQIHFLVTYFGFTLLINVLSQRFKTYYSQFLKYFPSQLPPVCEYQNLNILPFDFQT